MLTDNDLSDNWECTGNLWDPRHASCAVPQELSDQEIDEILALQVGVQVWSDVGHTSFCVVCKHACCKRCCQKAASFIREEMRVISRMQKDVLSAV